MHHHTIQINQLYATISQALLLDVMYNSACFGRPHAQHCYHHAPTVKPEAATAVSELLMMGVRTPKTC